MRLKVFIVLALVLSALPAWSEGFRGRAVSGRDLIEKVLVRAYKLTPTTFGPLTGEKPVATALTAGDGTFTLKLPAGQYVVEGLKKAGGNKAAGVEPGDLYCLHAGNPLTVAKGLWTPVSLQMSWVKPEARKKSGETTLKGRLTVKGEPLPQSYLYLYSSTQNGFKGPAEILQPVGEGSFNIRVAPGKYYLIARKRAKGGSHGPIGPGDLFNFYPLNPVVVAQGEEVEVEIPLIERLSQLDEEDSGTYKGVRIVVTDGSGNPLKGQYVLAYRAKERTGPPAYSAGPTGEDGAAYLNAPPDAKFLRVRGVLGGRPEEDEARTDAVVGSGVKEMKISVKGR